MPAMLCPAGLSRPLRIRRGVRQISQRGRGRRRHDRLAARQPWCDGRVGTFGLSYARAYPGALGCLDPPGLAREIPRLRRLLQRLSWRHAARRGVRAEAGDLGAHASAARPNAADPARKAALEAEDIRAWFGRTRGRAATRPSVPRRNTRIICSNNGTPGFSRLIGSASAFMPKGCYDRYADVPMVHMSSWYDPYSQTAIDNYVGLSRDQARVRSSDARPVDAWRALAIHFRRGRVRRRRRRSTAISHRISSPAPRLVRPLDPRGVERGRGGTAGAASS